MFFYCPPSSPDAVLDALFDVMCSEKPSLFFSTVVLVINVPDMSYHDSHFSTYINSLSLTQVVKVVT